MTGQSLLDRMELLNQELQLQSGEADVTRGLLALNVAQDYFESLLALRKGLGGTPVGTVSTTINTETTAFPTGCLRIDRLQLLDSNSKPKRELVRLHRTGGHALNSVWPLDISTLVTGEPRAYWTNGTSIYWSPTPSGTFVVRWYGFAGISDITASGTFSYPDIVALPLASFATRLLKGGVDDAANDVAGLAQELFKTTLDTLSRYNRDGASPLEYTQVHTE